jgi:hypothetical protein
MLTLGRNPFELRFFVNWHKQAIALKFRLLSVRAASGASVSNRKMSVMGSSVDEIRR